MKKMSLFLWLILLNQATIAQEAKGTIKGSLVSQNIWSWSAIDIQLYLPHFDTTALNKKTGLPESPKTDLFQVKKFDLLINLFPSPIPALMHIARNTQARCRVAPHWPFIEEISDLMVPVLATDTLAQAIEKINITLDIKPYVCS